MGWGVRVYFSMHLNAPPGCTAGVYFGGAPLACTAAHPPSRAARPLPAQLFLRARKWPALAWQAYAASALMEWRHEAKDTIPRNLFELGLRSHLGQPGLVLEYARFLQGARVLGPPAGRLIAWQGGRSI